MTETRWGLIWKLIEMALKAISPQIKEIIRDTLKRLEEAANQTPNPIDNIFVILLKVVLSSLDEE